MVSVGDTFQFLSKDGELRLTLVVVELLQPSKQDIALYGAARCLQVVHTRVLVLDRTQLVVEFRADVGETTDWVFDRSEREWEQLRRVA